MASQGPLLAGGGASDPAIGGATTWTNPGNIIAVDGSFASSGGIAVFTSQYLKSSSHGFTIPATGLGSTVNGIVAEILVKSNSGVAIDFSAKLAKAGTVGGTDKATSTTVSTTLTWHTYGTSTDLWGQTWTPADINATGFGFAWGFKISTGTDQVSVDAIRITVYYTQLVDVLTPTLYRPRRKRDFKIVERIRNVFKIIPIQQTVVNTVLLPTVKMRPSVQVRAQKMKPFVVAPVAPPPTFAFIRRPRAYQVSFPQAHNRALVTSVITNTLPLNPKHRLYAREYPVRRQAKAVFVSEAIQPLCVLAAKRRPFPVPVYVKRVVKGLFSSVTNVTTNVTTVIAPPRRARQYPAPYVVNRIKGMPLQPAAVVVGSARRLRAYPVAAVYRAKSKALIASVVNQAVPIAMRRTRLHPVPYQPKRVVAAFIQSQTVNALVIAPPRVRVSRSISTVRRQSPVPMFRQDVLFAPPKRVRAPEIVRVVKQTHIVPAGIGAVQIVPVHRRRTYQLSSQPQQRIAKPYIPSYAVVIAPRKIRQTVAIYPQKRQPLFVNLGVTAAAVIVAHRTRTIATHSVRRIGKPLPSGGAATSLVIAPKRIRQSQTLYPIARHSRGNYLIGNAPQTLLPIRVKVTRSIVSQFPARRQMASALFGQPVLVTSPRKVR